MLAPWGRVIRKAAKMTFEDHRVHPRANLRWSVSLELDGVVTEGVTKDSSEDRGIIARAVAEHLAKNKVVEDLQTSLMDTLEIE
jgi:hypothetical protein